MLLERIKYIFDEVWIQNDEYLNIGLNHEFISINYFNNFLSLRIYYNGITEDNGLVQVFTNLPSTIENDIDILNIINEMSDLAMESKRIVINSNIRKFKINRL